MATRITGNGPTEMRRLAASLATADPVLKRALRRNLQALAGPVATAVKGAVLSHGDWHAVPAKPGAGQPHHGRRYGHPAALRGEIADTVSVSVALTKRGVRMDIVSNGAKMPEGKQTLPAHAEAKKGWGHPVFLHGTVASRPRGEWAWVRQWGKPGWFSEGGARAGRRAQAAGRAALNEVQAHIEHG
jgi:hypothetical protein